MLASAFQLMLSRKFLLYRSLSGKKVWPNGFFGHIGRRKERLGELHFLIPLQLVIRRSRALRKEWRQGTVAGEGWGSPVQEI
ncbi:hypothetical protein R1flu_017126 [Riccia fluitans]|uniref:Uncharacterized protein n=1 Tax=Riccia fluitans TaxID=41844 RepID=A0ABD1YPM2_9MARC